MAINVHERPVQRHAAGKNKRIKLKTGNDYGMGIPYHEVETLARVLLPEIQAFFESEDGQREYAEWKAASRTRK